MTDPTHDLQALIEQFEALPRIVPSELTPNQQECRNGEYVSLFAVRGLLTSLRASRPPEDHSLGACLLCGLPAQYAGPKGDRLCASCVSAWSRGGGVRMPVLPAPTEGAPK